MTTPPAARGTAAAVASVTTLFFAWGFVTSMIDPLVASVRGVFELSFAEAMLTQFAWFIAYGLVSLPVAALLARLGYATSLVVALATMVLGCLAIPLATLAGFYPGVLAALFIIASGVTLLQVSANPLAAALGKPEGAHLRLMFAQAFNSLGTVLGPFIGSMLLLRGGVFDAGKAVTPAARAESLRAIDLAFLGIGAVFLALALFMWTARKRIAAAAGPAADQARSIIGALRSGWAGLGALAIFLYVGAEVSVGSMLTNFLHHDGVLGLPLHEAGKLVSLYWLGALVGRFVGAAALTRVRAEHLLTGAAVIAALMCLAVTQLSGPITAYIALSVGLFNSIMFPSIFSLTLEKSSAPPAATSGLLCMAIVGGAFLPYIAGRVLDASATMNPAFFVPLVGYLGIVAFATACALHRGPNRSAARGAATIGH